MRCVVSIYTMLTVTSIYLRIVILYKNQNLILSERINALNYLLNLYISTIYPLEMQE